MFTRAIVRKPARTMTRGLTTANLGTPDYQKALRQHGGYVAALENCGLEVIMMPPQEGYPDSTFVEDCAVVTGRCAVITRPGAVSRRGEQTSVEKALADFYDRVEHIVPPGTLDGGDVMQVGDHFFIGISARTNQSGARQLKRILCAYGYSAVFFQLREMLHLKTGLSYLEENRLIVSGEFIGHLFFQQYCIITIPEEEAYAANSLWVNGTVLVPEGFAKTEKKLSDAGCTTCAVGVSEFQKLDGGLSCLSIRF